MGYLRFVAECFVYQSTVYTTGRAGVVVCLPDLEDREPSLATKLRSAWSFFCLLLSTSCSDSGFVWCQCLFLLHICRFPGTKDSPKTGD